MQILIIEFAAAILIRVVDLLQEEDIKINVSTAYNNLSTPVNKETHKVNGSVLTMGNNLNSGTAINDDTDTECSSKNNLFRDSDCYFLYLFGKAWHSALEKMQQMAICHCVPSRLVSISYG